MCSVHSPSASMWGSSGASSGAARAADAESKLEAGTRNATAPRASVRDGGSGEEGSCEPAAVPPGVGSSGPEVGSSGPEVDAPEVGTSRAAGGGIQMRPRSPLGCEARVGAKAPLRPTEVHPSPTHISTKEICSQEMCSREASRNSVSRSASASRSVGGSCRAASRRSAASARGRLVGRGASSTTCASPRSTPLRQSLARAASAAATA